MSSTTGSTTPTGPTAAPVWQTKQPDFYLELTHSSQHIPENLKFPEYATKHTYFCYQGLKGSDFVIGIPEPYFDDAARGHALYITGVPKFFSHDQFEKIFRRCGTVMKSIAVINIASEDIFRWIVMSSFAEGQCVIKTLAKSKYGAQTLNICYASFPGTVIYLDGRDVDEVRQWQHKQLSEDNDIRYAKAWLEYDQRLPPMFMRWFDKLISASVADRFEGSTAESSIVQALQYANVAALPQYPCATQVAITPSATEMFVAQQAAAFVAASKRKTKEAAQISVVNSKANDVEKAESSTARSEEKIDEEPGAVITPLASQPVVALVVALPPVLAATPTIAPVATVAISSWANIAAPSATASATDTTSRHLMFDLKPENKSSSSAPRVAAPANPAVVAHAQGETLEEQMRVVFVFNLPSTITLQDVSDAVKEGPVLNIKLAADTDNGNRYAGIVFQYARDADAFHQILLQERANSTPGRFRFIVDTGRDTPYPYDDELEMMEEPMYASRRLTVVKKGFFFQFTKRQMRQLLEKLVTAEKIQLIWLYNGGNGTVVFSDVKSAVIAKTELDRLASGKGKGNMTAVFADLHTTFSKDPCCFELRLISDIEELNAD